MYLVDAGAVVLDLAETGLALAVVLGGDFVLAVEVDEQDLHLAVVELPVLDAEVPAPTPVLQQVRSHIVLLIVALLPFDYNF